MNTATHAYAPSNALVADDGIATCVDCGETRHAWTCALCADVISPLHEDIHLAEQHGVTDPEARRRIGYGGWRAVEELAGTAQVTARVSRQARAQVIRGTVANLFDLAPEHASRFVVNADDVIVNISDWPGAIAEQGWAELASAEQVDDREELDLLLQRIIWRGINGNDERLRRVAQGILRSPNPGQALDALADDQIDLQGLASRA